MIPGGSSTEKIRNGGYCGICGEPCEELYHLIAYDTDTFVCPKCRKRIQERIKHRYMVAGEHTEPAE